MSTCPRTKARLDTLSVSAIVVIVGCSQSIKNYIQTDLIDDVGENCMSSREDTEKRVRVSK